MRRVIHHDTRITEDQVAALMRVYGCNRAVAVRRAVLGGYRRVLVAHPSVDPDVLLVDVSDDGRGVRFVIHGGHHVPSVLTAGFTRRFHLRPWLELGGDL